LVVVLATQLWLSAAFAYKKHFKKAVLTCLPLCACGQSKEEKTREQFKQGSQMPPLGIPWI
jgi:hypothetical protein